MGADGRAVARGRELFKEAYQCAACHGETGKGDGPSAADLKDAWGNPISPRDLTEPRSFRKAGWHLEDTARVVLLGIPGTGMPSYVHSSNPSDIWAIARYVEFLRQAGGRPQK